MGRGIAMEQELRRLVCVECVVLVSGDGPVVVARRGAFFLVVLFIQNSRFIFFLILIIQVPVEGW